MKLKLFACKRGDGYCGGLIVVAAHDIDEAYNLYVEYGRTHYCIEYSCEDSSIEIYNDYPRHNWYQIPDVIVECDSPRVIDEDGYSE